MLYMLRQFLLSVSIAILCMRGYADGPTAVGLENMAKTLRGDVRLIAMGDSYCAPYFARIPLATLRVWPFPNITAFCSGAAQGDQFINCTTSCSPVSLIQSTDDLGYTVERHTKPHYFTLPLRGIREIFTSDSFDDLGSDALFEFKLSTTCVDTLATGVHGPFSESGDDVAFRFLYRTPTSAQVDALQITDNGELVGQIDLNFGARALWHLGENPSTSTRTAVPKQINASASDFQARNTQRHRVTLEQIKPLAGSNLYLQPAGAVYYHHDTQGEREQGLYYSHVSDNSWQFLGFGCDTEGTNTHDKKFSLEQFTYWLDVTTLDREQPTVFMWYFAPEALSYATAYERLSNCISQANDASSAVGITNVQHFIVIAPMFNLSGDVEQDMQYIQNLQDAAYAISAEQSSVSAASIYEATDQILFTGNHAVQWLLYHGFDDFEFGSTTLNLIEETWGDMLDTSNVHPNNPESAAFFAAILGNIIREHGCKADTNADGHIDVTDMLAVISNIGNSFVAEDINNDGIVDILDILHVIDGWGECWPVQAPFNTSYFK